MGRLLTAVKQFLTRGDEGASIVEYALTLALITVVCLLAIAALGSKISAFFTSAATTI
jgi:Flp pilus assembly pilin Flp